jgi:hypothetical protein
MNATQLWQALSVFLIDPEAEVMFTTARITVELKRELTASLEAYLFRMDWVQESPLIWYYNG